MAIFVLTILVNWIYAYVVQYQPGIIINSWSVLFPLVTLFYFVFSTVAVCGLYQNKYWGLRLSSFMILYGAIASGISMQLAYLSYPMVSEFYVLVLMIDLVAVLYIGLYYYFYIKK